MPPHSFQEASIVIVPVFMELIKRTEEIRFPHIRDHLLKLKFSILFLCGIVMCVFIDQNKGLGVCAVNREIYHRKVNHGEKEGIYFSVVVCHHISIWLAKYLFLSF